MKTIIGLLLICSFMITTVGHASDGPQTNDELSFDMLKTAPVVPTAPNEVISFNSVGVAAYFVYEVTTYSTPVYSVGFTSADRMRIRDYNSRHS